MPLSDGSGTGIITDVIIILLFIIYIFLNYLIEGYSIKYSYKTKEYLNNNK